MPDDTFKRLLVRLNLDTKEFRQTVQQIKGNLKEINTQAKKDAEDAKSSEKEQIALIRQHINEQKSLTAEARAMTAVDAAKAQWQRKQQETIKTTIQQRALETVELKKQQLQESNLLKLEEQRLKITQQHYRLYQQQIREQARQQREPSGLGGGILQGIGKFTSNLAGGGLMGSVAGGMLTGGLIGTAIIEGVGELGNKIRELGKAFVEATGHASQLREQFEKLTLRSGAKPDEFLTQLRIATRGLAADTDLYRISNNFMQQGLKVSNEAIVRLVKSTVDLARAQGKDATQAMQALTRASLTGRTMTLAYVTGLTRQELALRGISQAVDPVTRNTMQFNQVLLAMEARLKAIGTPATTLPELFEKWNRVMENWLEDIAISITRTSGFRSAVQALSQVLDTIQPILGQVAEELGNLGDLFRIATPLIRLFVDVFKSFDTILSATDKLVISFAKLSGLTKGLGDIHGFNDWVTTISFGIRTLDQYVTDLTIKLQAYADILEDITTGHLGKASWARQQMKVDLDASHLQYAKDIEDILNPPELKTKPAGPQHDTASNVAKEKQLERLKLEIAQETNKLQLELTMERLKAEEQATKESYEVGLINLKTQVEKERQIDLQEHQAKLLEIEQERKAKVQNIKETGKTSGTPSDIIGKQIEVADLAAKVKREQEDTQFNQREFTRTQTLLQDQEKAYQIYTDAISKINKEGVQERLSVLETEFKQGNVGADSYLEQRKELIYEERDVTIQGLNDKLKAAKQNSEEEAKLKTAVIEAGVAAEKQYTKLILSEEDIRLKSLESHYENAKKYLQLAAATAKGSQTVDSTQRQYAINQSLLSMTSEYLNKLYEQQKPLQEGSTEWTSITEKIAQATEEQQKLNTELIQMRDTAAPLGNIFGSLAGLIGQFKGTGAQAISQTFSSVQSSMEKLSQFSLAVGQSGGPGGLFGGLRDSFSVLFHPSKETTSQVKKTAQDIFNENLTRSSSSMMELSKDTIVTAEQMRKLQDAIQVVIDTTVRGLPASTRSFTSLTPHAEGGPVTPGQGYMVGEQGPEPFFPSTSGLILPSSMKQDTGVNDAPKIIDMFTSALKSSTQHVDNFGSKLKDFAGKLSGVVSGISGMVQGVTSGKTGGEGALSGGMSGMQLGASVGGPIGAAVGLGVGGVMGGIFGAKEKSLMQDIHKIQDQMQSIVDSMNEGAITLSSAIQDLRNERQQAIKVLSQDPKGGKGGGKGGKKGFQPSQAQAVIDQIDAEIAQLVNQQAQLLSQLDQQVAILSNPLPFQQYVSSLDQIIQKYQQFASAAAGNAQAVGNAQLFLNESLQSYVTTLSQQLNQAQQQAIQDALTLLNLEYQRQQIINQEAQQEYDILTQGVLTRQRTTAMTKGQQIGQLQYQANMQLQQIDEQIALQQYKVTSEQQIFNLATTRIGLEYQLLAAQEIAAGTQNEQTAALLQVVQMLQAGLASGSLMSSISALGPTGTGTGILTTLLGGLGLGGNVPPGILTGVGGATNYLSQIPQQYQSITNYINNLDPNFLTDLWSAMQTPPGSDQRMSVLQEAQPYANDANTSGYDFNSFAQWIQSGAAIQGSTATVNNTPAPTGPSNLPGGIPFQQPTTPGAAPSSIPGYSGTGGTPYDAVSQSMENLDNSTVSVTQAMQNLATVLQGINQGYGQASYGAGGGQSSGYGGPGMQIRRFQTGGLSTVTGPAIVDEGEYVLPKPVVTILNTIGGVKNLIASLSGQQGATSGIVMPGTVGVGTPTNTSEVGTHQVDVQNTLLDITGQRTNMEMTVISARQDQITAEVQLLQAYSDMMNQMARSNPPGGLAGNLESMFNQVYSTRGRYGSAGFRREYL